MKDIYSIEQRDTRLVHIPIKHLATQERGSVVQSLRNHIANQTEAHCDNYGYIVPNTVQVLDYTMGRIVSVDSESLVEYKVDITFSAINPSIDDIYEVIVASSTKAGIIGYLKGYPSVKESPILCMIPNNEACLDGHTLQHYDNSTTLRVSLLKSRVKYRGRQIQVVGKIV